MAARHADGRNAINHGSGRAASLARWLRNLPPERFDYLSLEHRVEGEWQRLQLWERSAVNELLAVAIDELAQDQANETGAFSTLRVAWWSSTDECYWTSRDLRCQPQMGEGETGQSFAGDQQSAMIQAQRLLERMSGMYFGGFGAVVSGLREANQMAADELNELRTENRELRARCNELEQENMRLVATAEQAADTAEGLCNKLEEQDKENNVIDLVTKALQRQQKKQDAS